MSSLALSLVAGPQFESSGTFSSLLLYLYKKYSLLLNQREIGLRYEPHNTDPDLNNPMPIYSRNDSNQGYSNSFFTLRYGTLVFVMARN